MNFFLNPTAIGDGMRVFKKAALAAMWPLPDGLHLTPAMSTQALHLGLRVVEVPSLELIFRLWPFRAGIMSSADLCDLKLSFGRLARR